MMLGARTAAWAKLGSGVPTARDYVQDGLIAMWDGIENAGFGEHDANATVWKDLSGHGYDLSCFNSYEWLDSAVKLSGGSRPIYRKNTVVGSRGADAHACVVAEAESGGGVIFGTGQGNQKSAIVFTRRSNGAFVQIANSSNDGINNIVPFDETLFSIAVNYSGGDIAYSEVNGIQKNPYYGFGGTFCSTLCVGDRENDSSVPFTGKVHAIRIYSRTLTTEEIAHNYKIDKARFGLP